MTSQDYGAIRRAHSRILRFERLEPRRCLAFSHSVVGTTLYFEVTAGNDTLDDVYVPAGSTTVWYKTDSGAGIDTGVAAAPGLKIWIVCQEGNDVVDLTGMVGFTPRSVALVQVMGGDGDDRFRAPTPAVQLPGTPGSLNDDANIRFNGGAGKDTLQGGPDPEYFYGDTGDDTANAGGGDDVLDGFTGIDTLHGECDDDLVVGGEGNDLLWGEDGNDNIQGNEDDDQISGGQGDDVIDGGNDFDIIYGKEGDDLIYGGPVDDLIFGDAGLDVIYGGSGDDEISGGSEPDYIAGESGDDLVNGDHGNDELYGGAGADTVHGGLGNDYLWSGSTIGDIDQPYNGVGPNPTWPDMKGTGEQGCDEEDGHPDGDPGC